MTALIKINNLDELNRVITDGNTSGKKYRIRLMDAGGTGCNDIFMQVEGDRLVGDVVPIVSASGRGFRVLREGYQIAPYTEMMADWVIANAFVDRDWGERPIGLEITEGEDLRRVTAGEYLPRLEEGLGLSSSKSGKFETSRITRSKSKIIRPDFSKINE